MATTHSQPHLSEEFLFFYEDQVCAEADHVYRYCVALTLQQDTAVKLLKATFKRALTELSSLKVLAGLELRTALLKIAYDEAVKSVKDDAGGASPLFAFLKKLRVDERAVLVARDLAGLTVGQIASILVVSPEVVYQKLAHARQQLHLHMN